MSLITNGSVPGFLATRRPSGSLAAARQGVQPAFAVISYKGKTWRIKYRGEDTLIRGSNNQPVQSLDVIIVAAAPAISKIYYSKNYVEGNDDGPDCFSLDGVSPDVGAPNKQNALCATCKHNQWGSRITDAGKRAKSCQDNRRIAIVPLGDIPNSACGGPMLLRLPPTTLVNFANYADFLERKGVGEMWWVGTRLSFDAELAYPRICFEAVTYIDENQDRQIQEVLASPALERIIAGVGSVPVAPAPAPALPSASAFQASDPPADDEDEENGEDEDEEGEEEEAPPAAPEPPPTPPAAAPAPPAPQQAAQISPFQRGTARKPRSNGAATAATKAAAKAAPPSPAKASDELEDAIGDLLDQPA